MSEGSEIIDQVLDRLNPLRPREKGYRLAQSFTAEDFEFFLLDLKERIDGVAAMVGSCGPPDTCVCDDHDANCKCECFD